MTREKLDPLIRAAADIGDHPEKVRHLIDLASPDAVQYFVETVSHPAAPAILNGVLRMIAALDYDEWALHP